jgi:hypothetical protein
MRRSVFLLVLFVFIVGIFVGIWIDWLTWRNRVAGRDIVYQMQDYQMANLLVQSGDKITLVPPPGGNDAGLGMKFIGGPQYNPCEGGTPQGVNPCVIRKGAPEGPYFYTCASGAGYACPDPGVQQSPTGPVEDLSYPGFVKTDFNHLLGMQHSATVKPQATAGTAPHPSTNAVPAYVSCSGENQTLLQDPSGKDLTTINASNGQTVFWISSLPFTLDMSSAPAGLCSNGIPGGGSTQRAECDVAMSGQTVQYKVQAQSCNALAATLITK